VAVNILGPEYVPQTVSVTLEVPVFIVLICVMSDAKTSGFHDVQYYARCVLIYSPR